MKQLLLFFLALHCAITLPAQYADTSATRPTTDYLKKSKNQKTAAWILLGGGLVVTSVGMAVGLAEAGVAVVGAFSGEETSTSSAGPVLMLTGLAAMVGSIPLFIASSKNRKKAAATVFLKVENTTIIRPAMAYINTNHYPAVAIRIRL